MIRGAGCGVLEMWKDQNKVYILYRVELCLY